MSTQQKQAWFILAAFGLACIAYLVAALLVGLAQALPAFGLFGLGGFAALIGRGGKPDERDRAINRRAAIAGFGASYAVYLFGCMGTWAVNRWQHEAQVPVDFLPGLALIAMGAAFLARSLAIVVLYGRRVEADHA